MPEPLVVPNYQPLPEYTILPPPDQAFSFLPHETEGESSSASQPLLDRDTVLNALATSTQVQRVSGWDMDTLIRRLDTTWSVENALKNCTSYYTYRAGLTYADDVKRWIEGEILCSQAMSMLRHIHSSGPNLV